MEVFQHAGAQMLILGALVLVGAFARKKNFMGDAFDAQLSQLVMKVTIPCMIIDSVLGNTNLPEFMAMFQVFCASFVVFTLSSLMAFLITRYLYRGVDAPAKGAHAFVIAFGNTGFIGFPVVAAIFGSDALLYGAIFNIPYNFFLFSVGMLFIARTGTINQGRTVKEEVISIAKSFISPVMISCYAALVLAIFHITDSGPVGQAFDLLGSMTVPAAMLIIGSSLAKMPLKTMINDAWSYLTTALRLIVLPLIVFAVLSLFIQDTYMLAVILVLYATPVATVGTMMCVSYGGDLQTMTRGTFLTTVFALLTMPIIALLVM